MGGFGRSGGTGAAGSACRGAVAVRRAPCRLSLRSGRPRQHQAAQRIVQTPDEQELAICGKRYRPRRVGDHYEVLCTLIETRGEGGLFLCHPTSGYTLEQGSFQDLPVLTEAERKILIEAACTLNEAVPPAEMLLSSGDVCGRPGDEFNERGDVRALLVRHGWTCVRGGENECWRRPGKDQGWSATLRAGVFYVFSSNAAPFEPNHPYAPFAVYALLEHQGDFARAASTLRDEGFGSDEGAAGVDISALLANLVGPPADRGPTIPDPGPIPEHLFQVPGFIGQVMAFTLASAPYPNVALAFCGAMGLQSFLAGRKVCTPGRSPAQSLPAGAGQQRNRQRLPPQSELARALRGGAGRRPGRQVRQR